MSIEEKEIVDFLKGFRGVYVSVVEVSRRVGARRRFNLDRSWARPILMRMEINGLVESNDFGEYRLRRDESDTTFLDAVSRAMPQIPLGETTIITLHDVQDEEEEEATDYWSNSARDNP